MISLDKNNPKPLYIQLYDQLKSAILAHEFKVGERLMGSRSFGKMLGVSRTTIDRAYSQLSVEGYIVSKQGSGFYVCENILEFPNESNIKINDNNTTIRRKTLYKEDIKYDLTNSSYTSDLFPKKIWKKYTHDALENLEKEDKISVLQENQGDIFLRNNLLNYLKKIRGINCSIDQIIITSGLQQSIDYLCKLFPSEQIKVLMEEPGYPRARVVFNNNRKEIVTAPVDDQGLVIQEINLKESVDLIYTTPSHQFPTGITMSIGRRYELLKFACQNNAFIIEDDYDSELRYYEQPIPSLQSIDTHDQVIYLGSFSKILSPSVRISYMILPRRLVNQYQEKFNHYVNTVNLVNQYIVAQLLETGEYNRQVRKINTVFKNRFKVFADEFASIKDKVTIDKNSSGQYFLLTFNKKINQQLMIEKAANQGVKVYSTMEFWQETAECPDNSLFLGFGKIGLADIRDCVSRLKLAWINDL